jgi:hypothetical protein
MGALELALIVAAALIGFTGTWSPCGFSMIETIGPAGHSGGRPTTLAACVTFFAGCLAGAVVTFGALAALGAVVHGAGGRVAYLAAAGLALVAAIAEARGTRIAPQVRRQLPEPWRRLMPMPVAAGLYGVLLGLGFTTFVLTFGVWALAGIAFAVGEPAIGLAIGLAFGIGRAAPVVALAPVADRPLGARCTEAMAMRPSLYRGARLGDAAALLVIAGLLLGSATASAQSQQSASAADPSAMADHLAFQNMPDRTGILARADGERVELPGKDPAIGGGRLALIRDGEIVVLDAATLEERDSIPAPAADAVAVSGGWLAYRTRREGRDRLLRRPIADDGTLGEEQRIAAVGRRSQIGQPDLDGPMLVYAVARPRSNAIVRNRLGAKARGPVVRSRRFGLSSASVLNRRVLYVRSTRRRHQLRIKRIGAKGRGRARLFSVPLGRSTLWSTALSRQRAYATILSGTGNPPRARIVSVPR